MEPREQIALTIQLPVEELGRLSRLLEQVRQLMAGGSPAAGITEQTERAENPLFDSTRFQALTPGQAEMEPSAVPELYRGEPLKMAETAEAVSALAEAFSPAEAPRPAQALPQRKLSTPPASPPEETQDGEILQDPTGGQAETLPEDPEERPSATALPEGQETPAEPAPSAGYTPASQLPEAPGGSWGGVREELTFPGPAPLTAEAVSQAFQRDDRRYDNGFPLY